MKFMPHLMILIIISTMSLTIYHGYKAYVAINELEQNITQSQEFIKILRKDILQAHEAMLELEKRIDALQEKTQQ